MAEILEIEQEHQLIDALDAESLPEAALDDEAVGTELVDVEVEWKQFEESPQKLNHASAAELPSDEFDSSAPASTNHQQHQVTPETGSRVQTWTIAPSTSDDAGMVGGRGYGYQLRLLPNSNNQESKVASSSLTIDIHRLTADALPAAAINPVSPVFHISSLDLAAEATLEITLWHYVTNPSPFSLMVLQRRGYRSSNIHAENRKANNETFIATKNQNGGSDYGSDVVDEGLDEDDDCIYIYPSQCTITADTITFTVNSFGIFWVEMPQKAYKIPLDDWQPDSDRDVCNFCSTTFHERKMGIYFRRKHHCRYCGLICCRYCCALRIDFERCCDRCIKHFKLFQQFREHGGEVCPISTVSMIVSCKVDWHANNFMGCLTFSGQSKQLYQHEFRDELQSNGVEYLVPHQIDFNLSRLSNRNLTRPQVRVSLKLRKADGTSYRLNSTRDHFIEGCEESFVLSECVAVEIECRAAGMKDSLHKNHKIVWRASRPMDEFSEGMDIVRDSSFMEFTYGKKTKLGVMNSPSQQQKQRPLTQPLRKQLSKSASFGRRKFERTQSVLLHNGSSSISEASALIDGELGNLQQEVEKSTSQRGGLMRRFSTGSTGFNKKNDNVALRSQNTSHVNPKITDALSQLETLLANVGRKGLLNPLQSCSLLTAMAADDNVNMRIKGRIVEILNQFLITLYEREFEDVTNHNLSQSITSVTRSDRIKMCNQIEMLEAAIHKREDVANPSALFRLKWATDIAKGGFSVMRDFESLESSMRECFYLMAQQEADAQIRLLDRIGILLKTHGHNATGACFIYSAAVMELSPVIILNDAAAFRKLQSIINDSLTQFGFYWPRTYSVLDTVCRFVRSIKANDSDERQQQLQLLFFGDDYNCKGFIDFVVFRSSSRSNCWRIREAALRMLYECTMHYSDQIRKASLEWIIRRRKDESRADRVFKFVDEVNSRSAVTNIKIV